ncbi:MAG: mechanosensitive ion channel family protein [Solobacterium sp.]|nr:mechanosensitive ion channel family protein [Solobacterium sp.]
MKNIKSIIMTVIALILAVLLLNPGILPFGGDTTDAMSELISSHFLIENSAGITFAHVLVCIAALCCVWIIYQILKLILNAFGKKDDHARTAADMLSELLKYIAVIAAVVWGLAILGVNTTAVLAGVGIIGLVLGFGAQSLIEDVITGMFIIFEGQYSVGDIIVLDDFRGTVRKIGVRTTVIEDAGGNLKVVNNSDIRNFQNRSLNDSIAVSDVDVAYDTDLVRLENILAAAFPKMYQAHSDVYLAEPTYLGVENLGESGITVRVGVKVREADVFKARRLMNRDLRILFAETGVEIPFPQVVVHNEH